MIPECFLIVVLLNIASVSCEDSSFFKNALKEYPEVDSEILIVNVSGSRNNIFIADGQKCSTDSDGKFDNETTDGGGNETIKGCYLSEHQPSDKIYSSCYEAVHFEKKSESFTIKIPNSNLEPLKVYCDDSDGAIWTKIYEYDEAISAKEFKTFNHTWATYEKGFGRESFGNYFIGLKNLHALTSSEPHKLLFDYMVDDPDGDTTIVTSLYTGFYIAGASEKYSLKLGPYDGADGGDLLQEFDGAKFSTVDQDNDGSPTRACSKLFDIGFWLKDCDPHNNGSVIFQYIDSIMFFKMAIAPLCSTGSGGDENNNETSTDENDKKNDTVTDENDKKNDTNTDENDKKNETETEPKQNETECIVSEQQPSDKIYANCHEAVHFEKKFENFTIKIPNSNLEPIGVYCDKYDDRVWTKVYEYDEAIGEKEYKKFNRTWAAYESGFGSPNFGNYFIGLKNLHALTEAQPHKLLFDYMIEYPDGNKLIVTAIYTKFSISGESERYSLNLGPYKGDEGGDVLSEYNSARFSTVDSDNDEAPARRCGEKLAIGFWLKDCDPVLNQR